MDNIGDSFLHGFSFFCDLKLCNPKYEIILRVPKPLDSFLTVWKLLPVFCFERPSPSVTVLHPETFPNFSQLTSVSKSRYSTCLFLGYTTCVSLNTSGKTVVVLLDLIFEMMDDDIMLYVIKKTFKNILNSNLLFFSQIC